MVDPNTYELTIEQQFQMRLMEESAHVMSREQALDLLVQASQLLMVKDNVIRNLLQRTPLKSFSFES
ncbi:MAG TPA: NblA/ycf18 family protein [Candidatus Obscuribacterales bacterium]